MVLRGMRTITGFRSAGNRVTEGSVDRANKLNLFFEAPVPPDNTTINPTAVCWDPTGDCPLSLHFTLYATDFNCYTETFHPQKLSDDSAIVECISKGAEDVYRTADSFVKTKELVVDLRQTPVSIQGVDIVEVISIWGSTLIIHWTG